MMEEQEGSQVGRRVYLFFLFFFLNEIKIAMGENYSMLLYFRYTCGCLVVKRKIREICSTRM